MASTYHFEDDVPDSQLLAGLRLAGGWGVDNVRSAAGLAVALLGESAAARKGSAEQQGVVAEWGAAVEAFGSSVGIKAGDARTGTRAFAAFFKACVAKACTPTYVAEDLVLAGLDDDAAAAASEVYGGSYFAVARALLAQSLAVNTLVDMDWTFGVTASSSGGWLAIYFHPSLPPFLWWMIGWISPTLFRGG